MGVALPASSRAAIDGHVRLLLAWNEAINLTAITEPSAVARLHVADSLSALPIIRAGRHATLVDLGSGGGFPGLPLAAALPETSVTLVDSVAKKVGFLATVTGAVGLADRVRVVGTRSEALPAARHWRPVDVVAARAVGSLPDLVELALPLLAAGGRLVAWKRGELGPELAAGAAAAAALGGSRPAVHPLPPVEGLDGHVLVVVVKDRPTPPGFPRDPAARKRRPW